MESRPFCKLNQSRKECSRYSRSNLNYRAQHRRRHKSRKVVIIAEDNEDVKAEIAVTVSGVTYYATFTYDDKEVTEILFPCPGW